MSAQEQGLAMLVNACRSIVPPQLDFVVMIFKPEGPVCLSSCMFPSKTKTPREQYVRAREAAQAFLTEKTHASFDPKN